MSEFRRRFVRLSVLLLPAFLALAGLYGFRGDLRDAAARTPRSGFVRDGNTFFIQGREREEALAVWVHKFTEDLKDRYGAVYGFTTPKSGFVIEVTPVGVGEECHPGSNRIAIRGIPDDLPLEEIKDDLSRLIARTMLREGAPRETLSPWFEEGVSRFFEGTKSPYGSIKKPLFDQAAAAGPVSLADGRAGPRRTHFEALSHSIVAFLHSEYPADTIARYVKEEHGAGPVRPGTFERIFGTDVERGWHNFLERRPNGN
jgi:hypothetical protein